MADFARILSDPHWLPHAFDPARGEVHFLKLTRDRLGEPSFLADARAASAGDSAAVPLAAIATAQFATGPVHFIFHTAFCRSTLMVRALEQPGLATGLSEPGIVASLVNAGQHGRAALPAVARLLARPWGNGEHGAEPVFVKPTNHANVLAPTLMDAMPQAKAVLMTNPLPSFLRAVVRKGMMGRRWARTLYLELMGYAGMDLGMDGREQFAMTDLQAGALAWFLNQRYLHGLQQRYGERVRVLDGDAFGDAPARVIEAVGRFTGTPIDAARAEVIAAGPVFAKDAKTGVDYAEKASRDAAAITSEVVDDEIAKMEEWIGMIAKQAGIEVPVRQTLI